MKYENLFPKYNEQFNLTKAFLKNPQPQTKYQASHLTMNLTDVNRRKT